MADRYLKGVLTVIAGSLLFLCVSVVVPRLGSPAEAGMIQVDADIVESGGTVELTGPTYLPDWSALVVLWDWSNNSCDAIFLPSADVQSPTWTAPQHTSDVWGDLLACSIHLRVSADGETFPVSDNYVISVRPEGQHEGSFPDVPPAHWAYSHIEAVHAAGIVQGYPDGFYHPDDVVTRDQMAVFIARAAGVVVE